MKYKLVLTDIDGVWTDGGMYYTESGDELKKFNTSDSAGVLFLKSIGVHVGIVTGENSAMVKRRAEKLNISIVELGIKNKLKKVKEICETLQVSMEEVAYIGDDINDMEVLRNVGLSACPSDAPSYIKKEVHWVMEKKGGEGVFREFAEKILSESNQLEAIINKIVDDYQFKQQ